MGRPNSSRDDRSYKTPLALEPVGNGRLWRVARPFTFVWIRDRISITVPKGFITDLASIPTRIVLAIAAVVQLLVQLQVAPDWLGWLVLAALVLVYLLPKYSRANKAAVLHDYLYSTGQYPRWIADRVFLSAMLRDNVPSWRAEVMYYAVRWLGWMAYRRKR